MSAMRLEKLKTAMCVAVLGTAFCAGIVFAAGTNTDTKNNNGKETPAELFGDVVDYSMKTGIINAKGHIVMKKDGATMTGNEAVYNTKSQAGQVTGNVVADKDDIHMTSDVFIAEQQNHFVAVGNVHAKQKDKRYDGPKAEYFVDKDYVRMDQGGVITSADGTFTADVMEGWIKEEHYKGIGNAHIVSPPRKFEGGGDMAEYFGKEKGKAILTGNAWAVQDGNTLKSQHITIFLDENQNVKTEDSGTAENKNADADNAEE